MRPQLLSASNLWRCHPILPPTNASAFDRRNARPPVRPLARVQAADPPPAFGRPDGPDHSPDRPAAPGRPGRRPLPEPTRRRPRAADRLAGPQGHRCGCRGGATRSRRLRRQDQHRRPAQPRLQGRTGRGGLRPGHALVQGRAGRHPQPHPPGPPPGARQLEGRQVLARLAGSSDRRVHGQAAAPRPARAPGHRRGRPRPHRHRIRPPAGSGRRPHRRQQADAA